MEYVFLKKFPLIILDKHRAVSTMVKCSVFLKCTSNFQKQFIFIVIQTEEVIAFLVFVSYADSFLVVVEHVCLLSLSHLFVCF